ncbi:hypothetical protein ACQR5W_11815 [Xanthomonas sacchari]
MSKPSWDTAPEWANWLAMDEDGEWLWYELKPFKSFENGFWVSAARCQPVTQPDKGWDETLESRP